MTLPSFDRDAPPPATPLRMRASILRRQSRGASDVRRVPRPKTTPIRAGRNAASLAPLRSRLASPGAVGKPRTRRRRALRSVCARLAAPQPAHTAPGPLCGRSLRSGSGRTLPSPALRSRPPVGPAAHARTSASAARRAASESLSCRDDRPRRSPPPAALLTAGRKRPSRLRTTPLGSRRSSRSLRIPRPLARPTGSTRRGGPQAATRRERKRQTDETERREHVSSALRAGLSSAAPLAAEPIARVRRSGPLSLGRCCPCALHRPAAPDARGASPAPRIRPPFGVTAIRGRRPGRRRSGLGHGGSRAGPEENSV